jgi:hypothetical protein
MFGLSAVAWQSSLYPSNWQNNVNANFYTDKFIQDFSYAGYHRGETAIPFINQNVIDVTKSPYNADNKGVNDATNAIQKAIDDVSLSGGVVYLPEGIYKLNPSDRNYCLRITKSNIVIRGQDTGKTRLLCTATYMRSKSIILIEPLNSSWWYSVPSTGVVTVTKNLTGPTNIIPLSDVSNFKKNDWVILRNSITDAWITEHNEPNWLGYGSTLIGILYCRQILDINTSNKTVTIDVPIRYSLLTRDNVIMYRAPAMLEEVGIENLSIGNVENTKASGWGEEDYNTNGTAAYDCHNAYCIEINNSRNCWIRNVSSFKPDNNKSGCHFLSCGIFLYQCRAVTLENCRFGYVQYGGGGGNGYIYRISSNECLLKNCIAKYSRHGYVFALMSASGNVITGCWDIKTKFQTGITGNESNSGGASDHHMHFSHSNLIDSCFTKDSYFAAAYRPYGSTPQHLITAAHSVYWNINGSGTLYSYCVWSQQARYGYVIGTSGSVYSVRTNETSAGSASRTDPVDHTECIGSGSSLTPQSLYNDQLLKRISTKTINVSDNIFQDKFLNIQLNSKGIYIENNSNQKIDYQITNLTGQVIVKKIFLPNEIFFLKNRLKSSVFIITEKNNIKEKSYKLIFRE